ncbi:hypothetical protein EBME_0762 [bacterium endosymbiont of Mortierella elongata FMR23-6]|nr:hypothetical protein EBME_0762 [bacterium endosymbiont of Mortierella elongata FMR23-6]
MPLQPHLASFFGLSRPGSQIKEIDFSWALIVAIPLLLD